MNQEEQEVNGPQWRARSEPLRRRSYKKEPPAVIPREFVQFAHLMQHKVRDLLARRAQSYFGELVNELRRARKDALQATQEWDAIRATLQGEQGLLRATADAVNLLTSEKQGYLETLEKAQQANRNLEDCLATTTSTQDGLVKALTAATTRQAELEGELAEMPKIQAEVAAAQAQILKDVELLSKAEADLAELLSQKEDLDARLLESQQKVTARAK